MKTEKQKKRNMQNSIFLFFVFDYVTFQQTTMNPNRRSRSPSRFSPIDEHPTDILPPSSQKHSPQSNVQSAQLDFGPEKYDGTFRSNGTHSTAAGNNDPLSRRSSGFQNKGSKENLFNDPIIIPITRVNSIPRLSIDVKDVNGNGNEGWERHEIQVKYHNERTGYPPAYYHHPMYYDDYAYSNRLQYPHQTMISSPYHQYYPQPDYPTTPKSARNVDISGSGKMPKNITSPNPIPSPQTLKSSKSHKTSTNKKQKLQTSKPPPKQKIYRKIHCCCFSFIWPPFAYEICEPPQPMYFKAPKTSKNKNH